VKNRLNFEKIFFSLVGIPIMNPNMRSIMH
jgi:hypothetical protein